MILSYNSELLWECSAYEIVMFVHELHQRGYEQMRLYVGMSPSGMSWRWAIYPKVFIQTHFDFEHGSDGTPFQCVFGSTGEDYPRRRDLVKFDDLFNELKPYVNLAKGKDPEYVEWFQTIVDHAENRDFPIAYCEYFEGDSWMFLMSKERLKYPPLQPKSLEELSDEQMIDYARCTFDEDSVSELEDVLRFEGIKPSVNHISQVIRQAIIEKKDLFNHVELGSEKLLGYPYQDIESKEEIENGVRIKMKSGEVIDLIDEIDLVAWKRKKKASNKSH